MPKTWDDRPLDSGSFKDPNGHENPSIKDQGRSFQVPEGKLGAFQLNLTRCWGQIGGGKALALNPGQQAAIDAAYAGTKKLSIVDGGIYLGWNPLVARDRRLPHQI